MKDSKFKISKFYIIRWKKYRFAQFIFTVSMEGDVDPNIIFVFKNGFLRCFSFRFGILSCSL